MTGVAAERNCIELVLPVLDKLNQPSMPEIQMMGGIGSAALKHAGTEILLDERRIVAPSGFLQDEQVQEDLARIRPNRTKRDLDMLVFTTSDQTKEEIKALAQKMLEGLLDVSVFNLRSADQLQEQIDHPFGLQALITFLSDRYVDEDGAMQKALFPFAVPIDPEVVEHWKLEIGDEEFQVPHPASTILNYLTRSISGLRWKDAEKVDEMAGYILDKKPELLEWMVDGPGKSQMELAGILHTIRRAASLPRSKHTLSLADGRLWIRAGGVRPLAEHKAFMLPDADDETIERLFSLLVVKSRILGTAESQGWIVAPYQRYFEKLFGFVNENRRMGGSGETEAPSLIIPGTESATA